MKIQRIIIVVVVSLFSASLAQAQYYWFGPPGAGPYFRAGVGPSFFQDSMIKSYSSPPAPSVGYAGINGPSGTVKYDVGVAAAFGFGWAFDKYVSLGFDTGYTWARMESVQNYFANNSSMGNVPFVVNLTLSMPIPHSNVVPYIGAGVGGSESIFDADNFAPVSSPISANTIQGSQSDLVFACQFTAGVRFKLNPNISVGVGYEFLGTGNPTFSYPGFQLPNLNTEFKGVRTHSVLFTFQANF